MFFVILYTRLSNDNYSNCILNSKAFIINILNIMFNCFIFKLELAHKFNCMVYLTLLEDYIMKGAIFLSFFVTDSNTKLLTDTLPALKIKHYYGTALKDNVYSYARIYFHKGALHGCFTSFDENPLKSTRMSLCLQGISNDEVLIISFGKHFEGKVFTLNKNGEAKTNFSDFTSNDAFTGEDEQGIFWNVEFCVNSSVFEKALGEKPLSKSVYSCNLFLHNDEEHAFAAAFKENELYSTKNGQIIVVPY